jgi:hypothetical protein
MSDRIRRFPHPSMRTIVGIAGVLLSAACSTAPSGSVGARTSTPADSEKPSPAPSPVECPGGECLPAEDLPGWRRIFTDDFAEPVELGRWSDCSFDAFVCLGLPEPYRNNWWAFLGGWTDHGTGLYSPSRVLSVSGGVLDFFIHSEDGAHLVAAAVPLLNGPGGSLGRLYGLYAVRFRADSLRGYKIAWLLWPDSEVWPRDGEIDFPEGNLDAVIEAYLHHRDGTASDDQAGYSSGVRVASSWHTAVIEWTAGRVVFLLDGRVIGAPMERIPDTPMHWVFETTTALDGSEPDDATQGHVQIDWVAVWEVDKPVE